MTREWFLCLGCRHQVPVVRGEAVPKHSDSDGVPCRYAGPLQALTDRSAVRHPVARPRPDLRLVHGGAS